MKLWTVKELATYLAVRPATIYLWVKQRSIPHLVLSRGTRKSCIRFRPDDIQDWLNQRQREVR
ncbi:MAG: helix-turn-helix domain-containing protein [Acidobacteria bacterium]|nr:helix-turn-helix domain-containing protein [Acidobacteriota bacterium]